MARYFKKLHVHPSSNNSKRYWSWKKEKNSRTFIWQKSADVGDFGDRSAASDLGPGQPAQHGKPRSFRQAGRLLASRRGGDANTTSSVAGPRHEPDGGSAKNQPTSATRWLCRTGSSHGVSSPARSCTVTPNAIDGVYASKHGEKAEFKEVSKAISPPKIAWLKFTQIDLLLTSEHTIFMSHLFVRRSESGVLLNVDMSKRIMYSGVLFVCAPAFVGLICVPSAPESWVLVCARNECFFSNFVM
jgi:hypothetical protein